MADYGSRERGTWDHDAAGIDCSNANCCVDSTFESGWGQIRKAVRLCLRVFSYLLFMSLFLHLVHYETDLYVDDICKFEVYKVADWPVN